MTSWNQDRYDEEKRVFIKRRLNYSPLWSQFTLIFAAIWGAAWFFSWFLWHYFSANHYWARNLPIRYAIAFLFAYFCFFLAVRVWIEEARKDPDQQIPLPDLSGTQYMDSGYGEGCLITIALIIIGFILGGFFLASGGAPLLLEAALDAAFAGVLVRRPIAGDLVLGNWKSKLLENTRKYLETDPFEFLGNYWPNHVDTFQSASSLDDCRGSRHSVAYEALTDQGCITIAQNCCWQCLELAA